MPAGIKFGGEPNEVVIAGNNVFVKPFTAIGFSPFIAPNKDKDKPYKVILKDNVQIGSSCSIERGIKRHTIIEKGTRIGNNVCIGYDTHVGKNCVIHSGVTIGHSCEITDNVEIDIGQIIPDNSTVES